MALRNRTVAHPSTHRPRTEPLVALATTWRIFLVAGAVLPFVLLTPLRSASDPGAAPNGRAPASAALAATRQLRRGSHATEEEDGPPASFAEAQGAQEAGTQIRSEA